LVALYCAKMR